MKNEKPALEELIAFLLLLVSCYVYIKDVKNQINEGKWGHNITKLQTKIEECANCENTQYQMVSIYKNRVVRTN